MKPIWSGTISFGLIHLPIKLYTGTGRKNIHFRFLRKGDFCPIKYAKVCRETGEEVPNEDVVKGYEYQKGDYVVLTDENFKSISPKKTQTIEISEFVNLSEIESKFYKKPYFVEPAIGAEKAYRLLSEALKKSKKAGIAKFILRTKEHLVALKNERDYLMLEELRYPSELNQPEGLNIPKDVKYSAKELDMAVKFIEELSRPFEAEKYQDTFSEDMEKIIDQKIKGQKPKKTETAHPADVTDIMAKLKKSLEEAKSKNK